MRRLLRRLHYLLRYRQHQAELEEEMSLHQELRGGRVFGNATLAREDARGVWIAPWVESVWQDLCYAARSLRRDKNFTLLALSALGASIGLNASLFAVFNGVMLRTWRVPDPEHVVTLLTRSGVPAFSIAEYA